jgi:hypothetical protein
MIKLPRDAPRARTAQRRWPPGAQAGEDSEIFMTRLLRRGIKAVEALSPDRQDLAGALLLDLAKASPPEYTLTPEQIEDVKAAVEEADRGGIASDDEVADVWRRFG